MPSLFDRIRAACAEVARRAAFVRVDEDRVEALAGELAGVTFLSADERGAELRLADPVDTVAFVLTWDTVNFGSGWFPGVCKRPGLSGSRTMFANLRDHMVAHGPWRAEELTALTPPDAADVFGQDAGGPAGELMALYARALNELGRFLLGRWDGDAGTLVDAADGSAERLVTLLDAMPFFHDVASHGGLEVPFYKRAQITASDLEAALGGGGRGRFGDLDRLTMFADNLVPHVLRVDGALRYDEGLSGRIDTGEPLEAGSLEEVEIRACGLHAVELLTAAMRRSGQPARAMDVDHLLWHRGQQARYKAVPRHRCRCVFY